MCQKSCREVCLMVKIICLLCQFNIGGWGWRGGELPGQHQLNSCGRCRFRDSGGLDLIHIFKGAAVCGQNWERFPRSRLMRWSWTCSLTGASEGTRRRRDEGGKRKEKKKAGAGAGLVNSVYLKHPIALLVLIAVTSESSYSGIGQFCIIYERNERRGAARSSEEQRGTARSAEPRCQFTSAALWVNSRLSAARRGKKTRAGRFTCTLADLRAPVAQEARTTRRTPCFFFLMRPGPHLPVRLSMKGSPAQLLWR